MDLNIELNFNSNYLRAIEGLKGDTLSEKKKTVSLIIKRASDYFRSSKKSYVDSYDYISKLVHKGLIPLVSVEVSKELKWSKGITEALLSTDKFLFSRALKAKWYFDGTFKDFVNPKFYDTEIFPFVSYMNRMKIIKTLSVFLAKSDPVISENLYDYICRKYSRSQALTLLSGCRFEYILDKLNNNFFVIPVNVYESIHHKYPILLVDYIKMLPRDTQLIRSYLQFWINCIPNNLDLFIEFKNFIYVDDNDLQFSKKKIYFLLKNAQKYIIEDPNFFLRIKGMENIEKYFSDNDIRELIKNSILNRKEKFYRHHLWNLLSVFSDKKKYFKIIRSVYSEIYGSDLITVNEFISTDILVYLPNDERYEIAKKKFLTDISWYTSINLGYCNSQWVCLLSIEESIPIIKERLKKASDPYDRYLFWKLIVLTCKINEDRNALKDFLTLLYDRYRNDHTILVFNILLYVTEEFDLDNSLCVKIERLIKILYQRNAFNHKVTGSCSSYSYKNHRNVSLSKLEFSNVQVLLDKILECKILDRCEDINEFIKIYCRIYIDFNQYCDFFKNISENNIKKKCLLLTLTQPQSEIYREKKLNTLDVYRILYDLFRSIKHINKENSNKKNIDIRDYSWILNEVSIIINDSSYNEFPNVSKFTEFVYQELPEFLHTKNLIKIENSVNLIPPFLLRCLKKDYKESLNSIDDILNILLSTIDTDKLTRYYINCCSWYNMFSLTLLDKLVVKLNKDNTGNVFKCLAMICEKSDLEELVKNISPEKYKDCVEEDKKKELIIFYKSVLKGLSMSNDLVNFKYVECLCQGEYFVEVINHMQNLALRYPVNQVSTFAMKLIKDRVSLRKQGLAIFYKIESFTNIISINNEILKNENNLSIRGLIYETILRMFLLHKTQETWLILLDSLKFVKIDDEIWELYLNINQISNEYRCQYIIEILKAIDNIYYLDTSDSRIFFKSNVSRILNLLQQDSITEEVNSYIFDNYYKNFLRLDHLEKNIQIDYLFIKYLGSAEESFDKRLENAIDLFFW